MPKNMINLDLLQRAAVDYDPILRKLPALVLSDFVSAMHFNLAEVDREDRLINMRRAGNLARPYKGTVEQVGGDQLFQPEESVLRVDTGYLALVDNIQNYRDKRLIVKAGNQVDHKSKEHPFEAEILREVVRTFVEDVTAAIPHAKRDENANSPLGIFDGFNTIIDRLIGDEHISKAAGNLVDCADIKAPTTGEDVGALTALVDWLRGLHPMLRNGALDIILTQDTLGAVLDAYENKRKHVGDVTREQLAGYLREKALLQSVPTILTSPVLGTGSRMIACRPGSITVGISSPSDLQFVQVRQPYTDPNLVQFWMQADFGTRVDDWSAKVFATNGGTIKANDGLVGDHMYTNKAAGTGEDPKNE